MNIELMERNKKSNELFYDIIDKDSNINVGILFAVDCHIAYEIYPEFRRQGIATEALKYITSKIESPILEITSNNLASKRVAEKAGYQLTRMEPPFEIYEYPNRKNKIR